jgi:hypothetical protein
MQTELERAAQEVSGLIRSLLGDNLDEEHVTRTLSWQAGRDRAGDRTSGRQSAPFQAGVLQ